MYGKAQIRGIIRLQIGFTMLLTIALLLIVDQKAAIASFSGGLIAVLGSVLYSLIAYRARLAAAAELLRRHFAAEMAKLSVTLIAFAAFFMFYRDVAWAWVFAGYLVAASAYWFGLLIKFDGKK
ncbi:ATP synthase subunit I [Deefgea piscis]|uniref:ATP synthase subunit I n=2 Tax=Chitinibacteraceae TaxID=2897177 RepID=A0A6M8SUE1_9NEIS|nr:ATP synthase subunit I [Deefgea piscis]QKJ66349.1 ATP synthase subunit I [Deefgea piscis]